ncbi:MAG: RsmB/NOP family class I SAM-dependent RNA methyltransferase [Pseudomonadota bacterium]
MTIDPTAARHAALKLIRAVEEDDAMIDEAGLPYGLIGEERARALSLARAVMRWRGPVDIVLGRFMQRAVKGPIEAVLRLGATEMLALGEAPYGVVDSAVTIAKSRRKTAKMASLTNAVLRKVAAEGPAIWADLDIAHAATPSWFRKAITRDWGGDTAKKIMAAHVMTPPLDLTLKSGDPAAWAKALGGTALPSGTIRVERAGRLSGLPGYEDGAWWVQDVAAAIPARLAGQGTGSALDICAAPGGKTMQLAAAGWDVTALDISETRLETVAMNLERTGLKANLVAADALSWDAPHRYDLILLDAPCSATGTVRRHPELPHLRDDAGVAARGSLQTKLLDRAVTLLKPGGVLIYCVCSLTRAEGEGQIDAFLNRTKGITRQPISREEAGDGRLVSSLGDLRTLPHNWGDRGGMDGFFAARLKRDV